MLIREYYNFLKKNSVYFQNIFFLIGALPSRFILPILPATLTKVNPRTSLRKRGKKSEILLSSYLILLILPLLHCVTPLQKEAFFVKEIIALLENIVAGRIIQRRKWASQLLRNT